MEIIWHKKVKKALEAETTEVKRDLFQILKWLSEGKKLTLPHIKSLSSIRLGLYEIRVIDRNGPFRVFYLLQRNNSIYLIHAFRKKTEEIPTLVKEILRIRLKEIDNEKLE